MKRNKESDVRVFKQSYRGFVRQNLDRIETKIAFGYPHELIRQELNKEGFEASLLTFRDALTKARRWREGKVSASDRAGVVMSSNRAADDLEVKPPLNTSSHHSASSVDVDRYFKAPPLFRTKGTPHEKT